MEGKKIVTRQADDDQRESEGIALDKKVKGIAQEADKQEEMEESEYIIKHKLHGLLLCRCSNLGP